ncbi:MAG: guanylate kinase [Fidelibacterota bacterium]
MTGGKLRHKNLVVISAPSGSGKTTICRELQKRRPRWRFAVSCTTRPPRDYENNGYDYEFLSEKEFFRRVDSGELVEHEEVHGYLYGTPRAEIDWALENDEVLLLEVDVKGGISIKEAYPRHALTVFVKPPSLEELKERLRNRGSESEEHIEKRMERVVMEMAYEDQYDVSVVNDNLGDTVGRIIQVIEETKQEVEP